MEKGDAPEKAANEPQIGEKFEFNVQECKTETVVIYLDRAEVCRSLKAALKTGENEITIKQLSQCIDKDSIRVEGKGPATISEVAFQTKHLTPEQETANKAKHADLQKQLETVQAKKEVLSHKKHRLRKQRDVLDGFANHVMRAGSSGGGTENDANSQTSTMLNNDILQGMSGFFDLYDKQAGRLDDGLHDLDREMKVVNLEIEAIRKNLAEVNAGIEDRESRELSVLLDCSEDAEVELFVSYVVTKAKWSPKYDIRVFSNEGQMKIMYYGMIQQSTGEDWLDAKLCLSTAMPSVGGTVPDLGTQKLNFKQRTRNHMIEGDADLALRTANMRSPFGSMRKTRRRPQSTAFPPSPRDLDLHRSLDEALKSVALEKWFKEQNHDIEDVPQEVRESITTTMYEIARRSTIPSDNVGHKVSVAIIDLKPAFEYESVPKNSTHAYLKAKVKNTSPYALLAGPTNIFLDNNFIAKAELKAVSPSEDFTCSLGVDPSVKVEYKPLHKFREQAGLISKNTLTTYKQVIELKNTHTDVIKVLVSDQLPLSTEEKIKVTLAEPQIKHPEKYDPLKPIRLNKLNNLEWDLEIPAGETKELILKYTVEHPVNEEIEANVTHFNPTSSEA